MEFGNLTNLDVAIIAILSIAIIALIVIMVIMIVFNTRVGRSVVANYDQMMRVPIQRRAKVMSIRGERSYNTPLGKVAMKNGLSDKDMKDVSADLVISTVTAPRTDPAGTGAENSNMTLKILNNTGVDLLINDITVRPTVIAGNIKGNTMSNTYFSSKDIKSSSSKITLIDVCSKFEDGAAFEATMNIGFTSKNVIDIEDEIKKK